MTILTPGNIRAISAWNGTCSHSVEASECRGQKRRTVARRASADN